MEAAGSGGPSPGAPAPSAPPDSAAPAPPRQSRRGPAPIASFDHDGSDESSPDSKQTFRLPEIREHPPGAPSLGSGVAWLAAPGEGRARSHSTPAVGSLGTPATPRIDISRASSSSHHDSRDSSPEMALFAGDADNDTDTGAEPARQRLELAFREDGALDLRSSTEELSFLEPAPGETRTPAPPATVPGPATTAAPQPERRHSRKDSQCSEAALLGVSGRTSRLSSVGSACSAVSHVSHVSRLSIVSGVSRSPSPHRMLLETSFCGPKPIETDVEACAASLAGRIIAEMSGAPVPPDMTSNPAPALDARDHREVRTEVTVEAAPPAQLAPAEPAPVPATPTAQAAPVVPVPDSVHAGGEAATRTSVRTARPRIRRQPSEPEVYKSRNKSKDIIRIKLRPDDQEEEEEEPATVAGEEVARKPGSLALHGASGHTATPPSPALSRRRSPSPLGPPSVSRKSSFCSLFKSRETIGSPDSPQAQEALRRKRSLTEGRARSKSRDHDRSATPTSGKIRGSVLSLFRTPRRSAASSSPASRATSPAPAPAPGPAAAPTRADKLKYYEEAKNGVIHIPLRTPPEERGAGGVGVKEAPRPVSAPQPRDPDPVLLATAIPRATSAARSRRSIAGPSPVLRTVLPDGSIIIPLHSPPDRAGPAFPEVSRPTPVPTPVPEPRPLSRRDDVCEVVSSHADSAMTSTSSVTAPAPAISPPRESRPTSHAPAPLTSPLEDSHRRRKERLVFTTHVGSREQVFSTQFSITKTPSVSSEISGSFPSFDNGELRDTHIAADTTAPVTSLPAPQPPALGALTPRDSSESDASLEAPPPGGSDVERRGLVVQESFEEELPYVPTTLPQERSVAMPMVPVRDRGTGVLVCGVQRPRAAPPPARAPAAAPAAAPSSADKLRIKLPRRPRVSSATSTRPSRERTRSGSADCGAENRTKQEWIDFEEVPERRKQPKRIQTLPVGGEAGAAGDTGLVFSYVEPEHCRCECHGHARAPLDDQLPLLDEMHNSRTSTSSAECGSGLPFAADLDGSGQPFAADLDACLGHTHTEVTRP